MAYTSNESKHTEVYVASFPGPGGKRQVSMTGGDRPVWRRDGKELFYYSPADGRLMAVEVNGSGAGFEVGPAVPLFTVRYGGPRYFYAPSDDGRRFLISAALEEQGPPSPIMVVVNWASAIEK